MKIFLFPNEFNSYKLLDSYSNILVVGGDSWSNRFREEINWIIPYATEKKFDAIVVCSFRGASNNYIFTHLVNFFCNRYFDWSTEKNNSWLDHNIVSNKKITCIVQWSSIIRDFSTDTAWTRPNTWASQPDWKLVDKDMYQEYVTSIFQEKVYSYKTQLYSWQLQKYFEKWKIPYYFWMGFCNLVPDSAKNTEFDLRKHLNKENWFNLYEEPGNMLDYLNFLDTNKIPKPLPAIMTDGSVNGFARSNIDMIKNMFMKYRETSSHKNGYFHYDLHPNETGHAKIAEILLERF